MAQVINERAVRKASFAETVKKDFKRNKVNILLSCCPLHFIYYSIIFRCTEL